MSVVSMEIRDQSFSKSAVRMATKQAWAKYVRNRWRLNAVALVQCEWDLSDGEARGLVYGHASQPTIDKIKAHRRGGLRLALEIEALSWGLSVEGMIERFLEEERHQLAREVEAYAAREARLAAIAARAADRGSGRTGRAGSVSGGADEDRPAAARVGRGR